MLSQRERAAREVRLVSNICAEQDLLAHSARESSMRGQGQSKKLLVREVTRTLSVRERERSGPVHIICAEQDLLAQSAREGSEQEIACARGHSHTQRKRAREVWSGPYHMCRAGFAHTVSARGQFKRSGSGQEIACAKDHSHTQRERAREVGSGPYHMCRAGFARTVSARGQCKRSGSRQEIACERSHSHTQRERVQLGLVIC